jgi:protein O-GlcNAc transferase
MDFTSPQPQFNDQQILLLGLQHMKVGRMKEAESCFRDLLKRDPNPTTRFLLATMLPPIYPSVTELHAWRMRLINSIESLHQRGVMLDLTEQFAVPAFAVAYQGLDDKALLKRLAGLYRPPADVPPRPAPCSPGQKIRVGFVSAHFREHTIGRLMHGLIAQLSRQRFEVIVMSIGDHCDDLAAAIHAAADEHIFLPLQLPAARQAIRDQQLDVLFYPDIGMEPMTYTLAFSRLAPVQCTTWGHPSTTGIPAIDYFISSEDLDPPDAQQRYTEKLVRLKPPAIFYARPAMPGDVPSREDLRLPQDSNLYGCPQSLFKFHPDFDAILAGILRGDPQGLLMLIRGIDPTQDQLLLDRFEKTMPDLIDRIILLPRLDRQQFLALCVLCDVLLDPIHFGGGNTSY